VKRVVRIAGLLAFLACAYVVYGRGFAVVASWIGPRQSVPIAPYDPSPARSAKMATALAIRAFGPGHWSTDPDHSVRYYDAESGRWMFAQRVERLKEGKRIRFQPFALIIESKSKSKKNLQTLVGKEAAIDFDKPFDSAKADSEPARVIHARVEGDVLIRDDKGTTNRVEDDLVIGPLTYLEYDEKKLQIYSNSHVTLREGDLTANGDIVAIDLRPNDAPPGQPPPPGFNGARTVTLFKNVYITVKDVGHLGIVPGGSPNQGGEPRPGDLRCAGPARFDLPKPAPKGQPSEPQPTLAKFSLNVRLRQGTADHLDQLDCDTLDLTLYPAEKVAKKPEEQTQAGAPNTTEKVAQKSDEATKTQTPPEADPEASSSLSGLNLKKAVATGHAVWLQSQTPTDRMKSLGNELIYERYAPQAPDKIFFQGNRTTLVEMVKLVASGPDQGKVESIDTIRTVDVTVFQGPKQGDPPTVIARGPGTLETRADRGKPVDRSAKWNDRLEMQTVGQGAQARKKITLIGKPEVDSPTQGNMTARDVIIAFLKPSPPKPAADASAPAGSAASSITDAGRAGDVSKIDWVEARGNVHLVTVPPPAAEGEEPQKPNTLDAKDRLDVIFQDAPKPVNAAATAVAEAPTVAAAKPQPEAVAQNTEAPAKTEAETPPKKSEPPIRAEADQVWARVTQAAGPKGKGEIKEARLRRNVVIHQDANADQTGGMDVAADAVDVVNRGEGRMWVEAQGIPGTPARVMTDNRLVEGPLIGLDQSIDYAWVKGPGRLKQEPKADAEALKSDLAKADVDSPPARARAIETADDRPSLVPDRAGEPASKPQKLTLGKGPVEIRWTKEMRFYGQPPDKDGQPDLAWAWFLGRVVGGGKDADVALACEQMEVHFDQPIAFQRAKREPDSQSNAEPEPKPEIVALHCLSDGDTRQLSRDPRTGELQKRRVLVTEKPFEWRGRPFGVDLVKFDRDPRTGQFTAKKEVLGHDVIYDKPTGEFEVPGPGLVRLYGVKSPTETKSAQASTSGSAASRSPASPSANPSSAANRGTATASNGSSSNRRTPADAQRKAAGSKSPALPPEINLTRITFEKQMKGRFDSGDEEEPSDGWNHAEFHDGVIAMHARVKDFLADLQFDHPPKEYSMLIGKTLYVNSEPAPPGSEVKERNLLRAVGNPEAITEKKHISGDVITYDSLTELFYVYGDEHDVYIADQDRPNQRPSVGRTKALKYNRKTGSTDFIDPKNFILADLKSGDRPTPLDPPKNEKKKDKPKRTPMQITPRNNKERRGFNSGQ
jgi:hypothetical protein